MARSGKRNRKMSFKRRIAISNAVMIAVPALAALVVTGVCLLVGWNVLLSGSSVDDGGDFQQAGVSVDAMATAVLSSRDSAERAERFNRLDALLDKLNMGLDIESADASQSSSAAEPVYRHNAASYSGNEALLNGARKLDDSAIIQSGQDAVRVSTVDAGGSRWRLYLQGTVRPQASGGGVLSFAVASLAAVFLAVVVSALLANRFVSRFLVKKMQEHLGVIEFGLRQLNQGNLQYRIETAGAEEFASAYCEFDRMADALESSITAVRQQDSRRAHLVADVSHDLRTPLASIKGYAEGLRDGVAGTPQARKRYLDTIIRKVDEMSALLERMLDYSKLELQQSSYEPEPVRVDELVSTCARDYADRLDIALDTVPATAYADTQIMRRVLTNILDNSEKYGTCTPAPVHISVGRMPAARKGERGRCRIEIADEGVPVDKEEAASLFDLFYRADTARVSTAQGGGIGMAFAKRAVEGMGGTISARPNGPKGLVVTIELPEGDAA